MGNELIIKQLREQREFETLFKNPKHARSSWAKKVYDQYTRPAIKPIVLCDKDGNILPQSQVELAVWDYLCEELKKEGLDRVPSDGEMVEACQAYYSRHNSSSYVARRDSMGAKPVDESKQQHTIENPYGDMTDEELLIMQEALAKHRASSAEVSLYPAERSDDDE